jgi:uncharacterized BrkB/YihY/UPF0761 family membrane protein
VIWDAVTHFNNDDGWAMASHVALSILMALFPFMIFGTCAGKFSGRQRLCRNRFASDFRHMARIDRGTDLPRGRQRADR